MRKLRAQVCTRCKKADRYSRERDNSRGNKESWQKLKKYGK